MNQPSEVFEHILNKTSKTSVEPAILALEDGTVHRGFSCGAPGEVSGEICFNTGLVGYLEVITDPSYAGQIVTMTYPQIGNYGVNIDDAQAKEVALRGLVVRDMCSQPSNWRSTTSLPAFLRKHSVVAIEGIDTRALVRHIREQGAMRAVLSTIDLDEASLLAKARAATALSAVNFVEQVSREVREPYHYQAPHHFAKRAPHTFSHHVVAYDCGVKSAIVDGLVEAGCSVTLVPWDTPAQEVLALEPDGVFLSNGPGDPDNVEATFAQVEELLGNVPIFGICLGHQMLGKAAGAAIEKLKYGHRGINQPVMNLITKRVEITVQNHGFSIVFPSLGPLAGGEKHVDDLRAWTQTEKPPIVQNERFGRIQLTHVNLNDGTIEGMRFLDVPAFSVQYHPEAAPGSTDSQYLFTAFTRLMDAWRETQAQHDGSAIHQVADQDRTRSSKSTREIHFCDAEFAKVSSKVRCVEDELDQQPAEQDDYLAIDIARDRLAGWILNSTDPDAPDSTSENMNDAANSTASDNTDQGTTERKEATHA